VATSLFSVGGLASGLDTASIINQLVQLERIPITQLETRRSAYERRIDAWSDIRTRLSALRNEVNGLKRLSDVQSYAVASSSDEDVVSVSVTGAPSPGALSFTVDRLATNHQLASQATYGEADSVVGAGTFTITVNGVDHEVTTTTTTTLQQLASQLTNLDVGVRATVIGVGTSDYRLVLRADDSGTEHEFTASGTQAGLGTFDVVEDAVDAQVTVGTGPGALVVERSSNTITDLLPGLTLTLRGESDTPVTVSTERDVDGLIEAIRGVVDEVNLTLGTLDDAAGYDSESERAGPLQGDNAAWRLAMDLRSSVSDLVAGLAGSYRAASTLGITLGADGQFDVNETTLRDALEDDPEAAARLLARGGAAADARLQFVSASDRTSPGTYAVQVTQAAAAASVTSVAWVLPGADEVFTVAVGSTQAEVTIEAGSTLGEAVAQVNEALRLAEIETVTASDDGAGHLVLVESRYGASAGFTVADDDGFGLNGSFAGLDVQGTIDGVAATGSGQVLSADRDDEPSDGLGLRITATAAEVAAAGGTLSLGSIDYVEGFVGRISRFLGSTEGVDGIVSHASDRWTNQIGLIDEQVERLERRIEMREASLRRQFAAMETVLSSLQAQGNWLSAQLANL
jgi:flagellar hook-associated protein 2